jgi:hypothetical protein
MMPLAVPEGARAGDTWQVTIPLDAPWNPAQPLRPRIVARAEEEGRDRLLRIPLISKSFWTWLQAAEDERIARILLLVPEGSAPGDTWEFELPLTSLGSAAAATEDAEPWAIPQLIEPRIVRSYGDDVKQDGSEALAWMWLGFNAFLLTLVMIRNGSPKIAGNDMERDQFSDASTADIVDEANVVTESSDEAFVSDPQPRTSVREDSLVTHRRRRRNPAAVGCSAWLHRKGTWSGPQEVGEGTASTTQVRCELHDPQTRFVCTSPDGWDIHRLLPLDGDVTPASRPHGVANKRELLDPIGSRVGQADAPSTRSFVDFSRVATPLRMRASGCDEGISFSMLSDDVRATPLQALASLE